MAFGVNVVHLSHKFPVRFWNIGQNLTVKDWQGDSFVYGKSLKFALQALDELLRLELCGHILGSNQSDLVAISHFI